jgi:hypothetical protein
MSRLSDVETSWGFQAEATYGTNPGGVVANWDFMQPLEPPTVSLVRSTEAVPNAAAGQPGTTPAPIPGSRDGGTLSFRFHLTSQPTDYDETADTPAVATNPLHVLINQVMGVATTDGPMAQVFAAAGSDANTWEFGAGPGLEEGAFYGVGLAAGSAITTFGWVQDETGTTVELLEDTGIATADLSAPANKLFQALTLTMAASYEPTSVTWLEVNGLDEDRVFTGCLLTRMNMILNPGQTPVVEMDFTFTSHALYTSSFALQTPVVFTTVPPINGDNGGRAWIGGTTLSAGTAETAGTCIDQMSIEVISSFDPVRCHSGAQGVADRVLTDRVVNITTQIVLNDASEATGGNYGNTSSTDIDFDAWLDAQTSRSITLFVGDAAGEAFGVAVPVAYIQEAPTQVTLGEHFIGYNVVWSPGSYSGDKTAWAGTSASNQPFRLAFA